MSDRDRTALIRELEALPARVLEAIHRLDDSALDTPVREGGWTVRQVVHHLADAHIAGWQRIRCALTEDVPQIKPYDQDAWAELPDARTMNTEVSLHILRGIHARLAELFRNLTDAHWARTTVHPETGETWTVEDLLAVYADHGEHHLQAIRVLRRNRGW